MLQEKIDGAHDHSCAGAGSIKFRASLGGSGSVRVGVYLICGELEKVSANYGLIKLLKIVEKVGNAGVMLRAFFLARLIVAVKSAKHHHSTADGAAYLAVTRKAASE